MQNELKEKQNEMNLLQSEYKRIKIAKDRKYEKTKRVGSKY